MVQQSIHQRLRLIDEAFLSAVSGDGGSHLKEFQQTWSTLVNDVDRAIDAGEIDEPTITLAHATASRVSIIADRFLNAQTISDNITASLKTELEGIFSCTGLFDAPLATPSHSPNIFQPPLVLRPDILPGVPSEPPPCPPYIAPAYKWLLKNLHNPYPSNTMKQSIARGVGTSRKHIDAWFMNVRRRMGWTALCKKFYMGSRSETMDAARRALVEEDTTLPPDVTIAFVELKYKARGLYSDKLKKSVLAGKLDVVVKDMTDGDREKHGQPKSRAVENAESPRGSNLETRRLGRAKDRVAQASYPSPDYSSYSSPEPACLESNRESEDDVTPPPMSLIGCKRRVSSSPEREELNADVSINHDHPSKRSRTNHTSSLGVSAIDLPSPQSSSEDRFDWWAPDSSDLAPETISIAPLSSIVSRKRRLSDADASPTPKRPRGLAVGPRLQAVSDPLPMSTAIVEASQFDSWFSSFFEIPNPVTAEEPDFSGLVDIELYQNWSFVDDGHRVESSATQKPSTPIPTQQIELSDSELRSVTPRVLDLSALPPLFGDGQFNFEQALDSHANSSASFGDSYCSTNDGNHLQTYNTSENATTSTLSPTPQLDFFDFQTSNSSGPQSTPFMENFLEEFLSSNHSQSSMSLPPVISSFTSSSSGECVVENAWSQFIAPQSFPRSETLDDCSNDALRKETEALNQMPNIDPSRLMLSHSPPDTLARNHKVSQPNAEKQAKLEKLRAHQEAVRRLEAELSI